MKVGRAARWFLVVAISLWSTAVFAAEPLAPLAPGLLIGPFEAHVVLDTDTFWESNVFHTATTELADLATSLRPSLQIGLEQQRRRYSFEGAFRDLRYYGVQDTQTRRQSDRSWHLEGSGREELLSGTTLAARGSFDRTSEPIYADYTLSRDRIGRDSARFEPSIEQQVGSGLIATRLAYGMSRDRFSGTYSFYDRDQHTLALRTAVRLFTTLEAYGQASWSQLRRPATAAALFSTRQQASLLQVGLAGEPSPLYRFKLELGARLRVRDFRGHDLAVRPDVTAALVWSPGALTRLHLLYQYRLLNGVVTDELSVNKGQLVLERSLTPDWQLSVRTAVWQTSYLPRIQLDRKDTSSEAGIRLGWEPAALDILRLAIRYDWRRRDSDPDVFDFVAHDVHFEFSIRY